MTWTPDFGQPLDLAIPLRFDGPQPSFFTDTPAAAEPLAAGSFSGRVASGASCNCSVLTLAPHCHGTHTECIGHVSREPVTIADLPVPGVLLALLVSVLPTTRGEDRIITRRELERAADRWRDANWRALIVRTLPNGGDKRSRAYRGPNPAPYFEADAMRWIVERDVRSLVVDTPSLDRADDGGALAAHRIYWGLPPGSTDAHVATRGDALVTEMAFVPDTIADGLFALALHLPAFASDAAPSRPVIYPLLGTAQ